MEIELSWRNFPGIVSKGHYAALDGVDYMDCPYDEGSPQKRAWVRGYIQSKKEMRRADAGIRS